MSIGVICEGNTGPRGANTGSLIMFFRAYLKSVTLILRIFAYVVELQIHNISKNYEHYISNFVFRPKTMVKTWPFLDLLFLNKN